MDNKKTILTYFGHHKCGSKMIMNISGRICKALGMNSAHFHSPKMWGYDTNAVTLDQVVDNLNLDFVSYISADINYIGAKDRYRGFHVIRDPRDIVASSYFSHKYSHETNYWPELAEFRKELEKLPKDEGFLENIKFTARLPVDGWNVNLFDTLMNWNYSQPNVMEIKFEELIADPYSVFMEMFKFLGIVDDMDFTHSYSLRKLLVLNFQNRYPKIFARRKPFQLPAFMLLSFVYLNRFSNLTKGRDMGQEDVKSHYRKGTAGDWKNHFTDAHKAFFKKEYNDLLIKLGYENDDKW